MIGDFSLRIIQFIYTNRSPTVATPLRMAKSCGYFAILAVATDLNMGDGKPREHEALNLYKMSTY